VPRRRRRNKRRDLLTLQRDLMLSLGPEPRLPWKPPSLRPGSPKWEALHYCFEQNRDRYGPRSWGWLAFGPDADVEAAVWANELVPADADKNKPVD
jgi:hypothetical protein